MKKKEEKILHLVEGIKVSRFEDVFEIEKREIDLKECPDLSENDGFIEVRDQQLFVIEPKEGGKFPVLLPNPDLNIYINDQPLKTTTVVTSRDEIKVYKKVTPNLYSISISEDKMTIFLQVQKELYYQNVLKNHRRSNQVMLELEDVPVPCQVDEVSSKIVEDILKKGIQVEIDSTAIIQELINPTFKEIKVAEGLPPIPPVDSILERYFPMNIEEVFEEVNGEVDFKNRLKIPDVTPGEVIAKLYPPKEGKEGYDVFGQIISPRSPKKVILRPKPRVRVIEDGNIIALQQGRPTITGQTVKYIDILNTYEAYGDVDMSTGNICFQGDIIVRGNVKDHMKVESSGSIYVLGNVYSATIIAAQDIKIRGTVINSKVIAGQLSMFYSQLNKKLQDLAVSFKRLIDAMEQLKGIILQKEFPFDFKEAFVTLFEMKFKYVFQEVEELEQLASEIPNNENDLKLRILLNSLAKFKNYHTLCEVRSLQILISVQFSINELIDELNSMVKMDSSIQVKSANMSSLKTNGDIIIKDEGIVQSNLFAGGNIIFKNKKSSIRSSKLEALKRIEAGTVGTETGEAPLLYAGEMMQMECIYQGRLMMPYFCKLIDQYQGRTRLIFDPVQEKVTLS